MTTAILLSGGIDSTALAFWQHPDVAFTVNYGQLPAIGEIRAAKRITQELGIPHEVITVNCRHLGSGDLAGLPQNTFAPVSEWWPFRNQLLVTLSVMMAINIGIDELIFGTVSTDSIHVDGKGEFFELLGNLVSIQEGNIKLRTPAINMTSVQLVQISKIEPALLLWSHSCHKYDYACGNCRGCNKHHSVLSELGYIND